MPEEAPSFGHAMRDTWAEEGSMAYICVTYLGNPVPEVKWFKNGHEVSSDHRITFTNDGHKAGYICFCNFFTAQIKEKVLETLFLPKNTYLLTYLVSILSFSVISIADILGMICQCNVLYLLFVECNLNRCYLTYVIFFYYA